MMNWGCNPGEKWLVAVARLRERVGNPGALMDYHIETKVNYLSRPVFPQSRR
jgi:hypothetical protein